MPLVLREFTRNQPRIKVQVHSGQTFVLKERFARGELDIILTTEAATDPAAVALASEPLVWIGAPGGTAWRRRPLPLGTVAGCIFNRASIETLERRRASTGSSRSTRCRTRRWTLASRPTSWCGWRC